MVDYRKNKSNKAAMLLFLVGLFSQTQVHFMGSIGISELPIFILAPYLFVINYRHLKHEGFLTFLWLIIAVCIGCVISSLYNSTPFVLFVKGLATPYSIFAITVVLHHLLRKELMSIKWLFVGMFLSLILSVFIFQPETYTFTGTEIASGEAAVKSMMSYPLFWAIRINALVSLPIKCMYLKTPLAYSIVMTLGAGLFSILFSDSSGRATAMISLFNVVLLFLGGKSQKRIALLGRKFPIVLIVMVVVGLAGKFAYSFAAETGALGDKALEKYEKQTEMGSSTIDILMAGRKEFFVGIMAAMDKPIIGHGPSPEDKKGYFMEYLSKYGSLEDYEIARHTQIEMIKQGFRYFIIPTHSFIASFWVYYGICGLIFWVYCFFLIWRYFRKYASAIPQLFGYLAVFLPTMVWGAFFAPFGDRVGCTLPLICILFSKAVYEGRMRLPIDMEMEVTRHN